ncbi:MAG TPA: hypothetical protein VM779_14410 [Thermoanaerobaculia bacterium]|nr:hypothetical protein [Thermoanaerobaculia bacterium]
MVRRFLVIFVAVLLVLGCQREEPDATVTAPEPAPQEAPPPEPVVLSEGFSTPESVLHDAEQDVYFVSNINGSPTESDDNGFISRIDAETHQVEAKWIDGAAPNVRLSAPKGMAIVGDELWVTDITSIARFDRRTGAPKGTFRVPGATFLNDLVGGESVYASDSGMKSDGSGGFAPTGTDAVWEVTGGKPRRVVRGSNLNRPNGLAVRDGKVWVVTFGAAELYPIENGAKGEVQTLPAGSLDGLVILDDGSFLVSSWDGSAVYRGQATGGFQAVVENVQSPADIGFDAKRNLILVPHFMENRVSLHPLR